MAEVFKPTLRDIPFETLVIADERGSAIPPMSELVETIRSNPQQIVADSELAAVASTWHIETVVAFHLHQGVPEEVAQNNRQNREEEMQERLQRISDPELPIRTRKQTRAKLGRILKAGTTVWDQLSEEAQDTVVRAVYSWRQSRNHTIFGKDQETGSDV